MNRKQMKQMFTQCMGESDYEQAYGKFQNTLLKDLSPMSKELSWNIVFYSFKGNKHSTRAELFETYGYKDLRA